MQNFKPQIRNIPVSELYNYLENFFSQTEQVTISFNAENGLSVEGDENYLQVIMQNLTANAVRALRNTNDAKIGWNAKKDGINTILTITDNGPGISNEHAKVLLEDNKAVNAKSGFGLHLVRDLAKAIHYNISVESAPGMGTTFILSPIKA